LTVEDHSIIGGLGSAVAELLSSKYPLPVKVLGVPDVFGESARNWQELLIKYKIDSKSLTKVIKDLIGE
jgi:transketolase